MKYKNPRLTVDGAIVSEDKILLIKRNKFPFKDRWALPGGYVEYGEKVEDAVIREVLEETGLKVEIKKLFGVYSDPDRDPRGHTVTIVYLMNAIDGKLESDDDASDVRFFELEKLPELAFDHKKIINDVIRWLK
ncbi:MAG: NUDIX hydrolase [Candidatus Thermoplasmatota archaeon]|nr:NUDIX hydrolase [Candidatus Thermoplasmatota archaeon]